MSEKKKAVFKLELHDEKSKNKAMAKVSRLRGIDSVALDMKAQRLTVIGDIDAALIVSTLRRVCHSEILTVGPAVPPKVDPPKVEPPKAAPVSTQPQNPTQPQNLIQYHPNMIQYPNMIPPQHYYVHSVQNDPNACVIC